MAESYAHSLAKDLVVSWLRNAAASAGRDEFANCFGHLWRVNRDGPHWGVWSEYPILADRSGIDPVWDEEKETDKSPPEGVWPTSPWEERPPSYEELISEGRFPGAILDIAIQHKGSIIIGIEIRHKHPVSRRKMDFLEEVGMSCISVLELLAYWVLGQVAPPTKCPAEFWIRGRENPWVGRGEW